MFGFDTCERELERVCNAWLEGQITERDTPRLACREVAARKRNVPQARHTSVSREVGNQSFRTPHIAVITESRSVEGKSHNFRLHAMLGRDRSDVRVVMLY